MLQAEPCSAILLRLGEVHSHLIRAWRDIFLARVTLRFRINPKIKLRLFPQSVVSWLLLPKGRYDVGFDGTI